MSIWEFFDSQNKIQNKEWKDAARKRLSANDHASDSAGKTTDFENEMITEVYSKINQDVVQKIFYGDAEQAKEILIPLREILFGAGAPAVEQFSESAAFYVQVWIRKHGGFSPEFSSTPYIVEAMKNRFSAFSGDAVAQGVNACLQYIFRHEPSLTEKGIKTNTAKITLSDRPVEFVTSYRQGVELFNAGKHSQAIKAFERCLTIREDDTNSRFEIAEAYIAMADFASAKDALYRAVPFISTPKGKARFFRRLAFIETEHANTELAASLLLYSLQFEMNQNALNELKYIESVTGKDIQYTKEEILQTLKKNNMLFWSLPSD